jgi:hypothetical protein
MTQSCPPRDALIDAAAPDSDPTLRERLADHLIACPSCAEDFKLLQAIGPWAAEHAHLLERPDARVFPVPVPAAARRSWLSSGYAVAAVLAVVAVALTFQIRRLIAENDRLAQRAQAASTPTASLDTSRAADQQRIIADLEQRLRAAETPDLNPPIIDLETSDAPRTATPPVSRTAIGDARRVVFILNTAHRRAGAVFDVDLVDAGDRVVWTGSGLRQSADGTLTLGVPRALASPGSRIRLYARTGDRRTLVEQYVVPASQ